MKLTKAKLLKFEPCKEGFDWYIANKETDLKKICYALIEQDKTHWANWVLVRLMTLMQKRQYAIFAAEQVLDIFEKKYPDDKRPRDAISAAKAILKNPSKKNKDAAHAASYAAYATAYATGYAAYAASYAAGYAAHAASYAAVYAAVYAAADAADAADAAGYAAHAAARKEMQTRIVNYGLKLLGRKP